MQAPEQERARWLPEAKSTLLLAVQKGPFRRPCPGTRDYICCGYQVLQVTVNCPMDCTYCVLQGYVNVPAITIFVNVEDLLAELTSGWAENPGEVWRLGTGEFGDSLALDSLTGLNERLIPWFAGRPRALLEIKSKRPVDEDLLALGPNPRVVFAWSLNPEEVIGGEEKLTAPLAARLRAAERAAAAGFRIAFHFDPLIYFPGWEEAYRRTVARLGEVGAPNGHSLDQPGGPAVSAPFAGNHPPPLSPEPHCGPGDGPGPGRQAPLFQEPARRDVRPDAGVAGPGRAGGPGVSLHGKPQSLAGGFRVLPRSRGAGADAGCAAAGLRAQIGQQVSWVASPLGDERAKRRK